MCVLCEEILIVCVVFLRLASALRLRSRRLFKRPLIDWSNSRAVVSLTSAPAGQPIAAASLLIAKLRKLCAVVTEPAACPHGNARSRDGVAGGLVARLSTTALIINRLHCRRSTDARKERRREVLLTTAARGCACNGMTSVCLCVSVCHDVNWPACCV